MKRGFTLVELLITISVIALLAAIVIPSLRVVQARGNSAKCLGHLRQLGAALQLYLGENQMIMPTLKMGRLSKDEDLPVIDNTLNRYVDDMRIFTCPADRKEAAASGTSYCWNSLLNGQPVSTLKLVLGPLEIGTLSNIPILFDKEGWHHFTEDKVNHLFADGHVTNQLRLFAE